MSTETYQLLAHTICLRYPLTPVHCRSDRPMVHHSLPLDRNVTFFDYVIIHGRRYYGSRTVRSNRSSFVHVAIPGPIVQHAYGEVLEIFQFNQQFRNADTPLWLARMRWFVPWSGECEKVWTDL
jgi:hypothetical protein